MLMWVNKQPCTRFWSDSLKCLVKNPGGERRATRLLCGEGSHATRPKYKQSDLMVFISHSTLRLDDVGGHKVYTMYNRVM